MPLPTSEQSAQMAWPPVRMAKATTKLDQWGTWYGGDQERLHALYGGQVATTGTITRPSQRSGGLVGAVARMFWGQPTTPGQQRHKLHVPVAGDIATASSDLLFAEALQVKTSDGGAAQDRLQFVLDGLLWDSLLPEQGELGAAFGGVFLRVVWDREVEPRHPLATVVHADAAWPEFSYGRLKAVTFWTVVGEDANRNTVLRLLERHERGRIEYGLYEGNRNTLGRVVDFGAASEATSGLQVDETGNGIGTGWDGLTAVYIPNLRPTLQQWASDPFASNLGRSDYAQVEPLFDAVDETMTSWMRDVRLGKSRIIVPNYMLQNRGVGNESVYNVDQEVFVGLAGAPGEDEKVAQAVTEQQFTIRAQEHADTLKELLTTAYRKAGYSAQTFGIVEEGAPTATEVDARERRSYGTREKKSRYQTDGLQRFLQALLAIDTVQFQGGAPLDTEVKVEFPAGAQPTVEKLAQSVQMLRAAQALSIDSGVRMVHPDWDDPQVQAEVEKILAEERSIRSATPVVRTPADAQASADAPPAAAAAVDARPLTA